MVIGSLAYLIHLSIGYKVSYPTPLLLMFYFRQTSITNHFAKPFAWYLRVFVVKKNPPIFPKCFESREFSGRKGENKPPDVDTFLETLGDFSMSFFWPPKSSQRTMNFKASSYITQLLFSLQHHCLLLDVERPFFCAQNFWRQYCTQKQPKKLLDFQNCTETLLS